MKRNRWVLKGGKVTPHILEKDVVKEIIARLWLEYRIKVWQVRERIPGEGVAPSTAGLPDLVGWIQRKQTIVGFVHFVHGKQFSERTILFSLPLFIECKKPHGGVRRPAQIQFIEEARRDGCVAFFASSWDDVVKELDEQAGIKLKEAA